MGRRNDHSREEIREMALQAAVHLLMDTGPQGLSARKIANEIGYTVGTLYLVFKNLDDLIMQVNLRTLRAMHKSVLMASHQNQAPLQQLKSIAAAYIHFAREHEHQWRLMYEYPFPDDMDMPGEYRQVTSELFAHIENILEQVNTVHHDSIRMHARALWGGVHGICVLSLAGRLDHSREYSLKSLTDILVERFVSGQLESQ